jgi:hypothetical protein
MIIAIAAPAQAQCAVTQIFGATGDKAEAGRIFIATAVNGFPTDGNEKGSFYDRDNAQGNNNGGPHFAGPDLCTCLGGPNWCRISPSGVDLSIVGAMSSPTCQTSGPCQEEKTFVFIVEDQNDDGTDAGFITYQVDWSTQTLRAFDHARTADPNPMALTTHVMERFPTVDVQSSSGPPPTTQLNNDYANVVINFHGVEGLADNPVDPDTANGGSIAAYDICTFRGTADPGRERVADGWTCAGADQIVYTNPAGPVSASFDVPCPDTDLDTFVAVGIEFVGGVDSVYVGESTAVECNPTIADPDEVKPRRQDRLGTRGRMTR